MVYGDMNASCSRKSTGQSVRRWRFAGRASPRPAWTAGLLFLEQQQPAHPVSTNRSGGWSGRAAGARTRCAGVRELAVPLGAGDDAGHDGLGDVAQLLDLLGVQGVDDQAADGGHVAGGGGLDLGPAVFGQHGIGVAAVTRAGLAPDPAPALKSGHYM